MTDASATFEVVKVTGNPENIDIDALVGQDDCESQSDCEAAPETFDGYFPEDGYDYTQHLREINQERFVPSYKQPVERTIDPRNRDLVEIMASLESPDQAESGDLDVGFVEKLGPIDQKTRIALLWGEDQVEDYLSMPTDKLMAIRSRMEEREKQSVAHEADKEFEAFFAREFADGQIGSLNPDDVEIDLSGKKQEYMGIVKLPFIDFSVVKKVYDENISKVDKRELRRNNFGKSLHYIYNSDNSRIFKSYYGDIENCMVNVKVIEF
jgi:hypothetical protein